ncbi:YmfQ family protein [Vermiculatibacterium agrestimuris]|uniref:YmfQ family protein n=1 Tax=Vermiculatibacterium agrestimuris TaxID=2941519 RepID=UPI00203AC5A4|nr:YmfQ family protein [Vermiculatibacterium agrestimuris]
MSHAQQLWELLLPLGPYSRQGIYTAGELAGEGRALDEVSDALSDLEREAMLDTAEGEGLERLESLLIHRPVAETPPARRAALAALLRIGGDSFTLAAINDNLKGCGLNAQVSETGNPGVVEVRFPDVPGIPEGFKQLRKIIEEILPAHLQVNYVYWYVTWQMVEDRFHTWGAIEEGGYNWDTLEKLVK